MIRHFKKLMYECFPDADDRKAIDDADNMVDYFGLFEEESNYDMYNCNEDIVISCTNWLANEIKIASAKYRDKSNRPTGWTAIDCIMQQKSWDAFDWIHVGGVLSQELGNHDGLPPYPLDKVLRPLQYQHYIDYKKKYNLDNDDKIDAFLKGIHKECNVTNHKQVTVRL